MKIAPLVLALLLLLAACTSPPSTPTRYLLPVAVPEGSVRVDPPVHIGLGVVSVAPYLAQSGLVVETADHEVRTARQHEWAEPLEAGVRRQLRAAMSDTLGIDVSADPTRRRTWDHAVDVTIDRLHGTLTGDAVLVARWRITSRASADGATTWRIFRRQPLARAGYAGLVEAEIALIDGLAAEIAASLSELVPR